MLESIPEERDLRGKAWVFVLFNFFAAWVIVFGLFAACLVRSAREHSVSGISALSAMSQYDSLISSVDRYSVPQRTFLSAQPHPSVKLTVQGINIDYYSPIGYNYSFPYIYYVGSLQEIFVIKNPSVAETYRIDDEPYLSILILWIFASILMLMLKMLPIHRRVDPVSRRVLTGLFVGCVALAVCSLFAVYFIMSTYPSSIWESRFDEAYRATIALFQNDKHAFLTTLKLYPTHNNSIQFGSFFQSYCFRYGYFPVITKWYFFNRGVFWLQYYNTYAYCTGDMQPITNESLSSRLWQGRRTLIQQRDTNPLYNDYKHEIDILTELEEKYRCAGWSHRTNATIFTRGTYESSYTCKSILMRDRTFELIVFGYGSIVFLPLFVFAFCYYTHLTKKK